MTKGQRRYPLALVVSLDHTLVGQVDDYRVLVHDHRVWQVDWVIPHWLTPEMGD